MTAIQVAIVVVLVISVAVLFILYMKSRTLDQIRGDVYKLFLEMEHRYIKSGEGRRKLDAVVASAYEMLPSWARLFFTKDVLRKIINTWFAKIKDLLDDGKLNGSGKRNSSNGS